MSRRERYPLQTLLKLREHRAETARQALLERQRQTEACRDVCAQVEREIQALRHLHAGHRGQLLASPADDMAWSQVLAQRERHIALLLEQMQAAQVRRTQAQQALEAAEQAQAQARAEYFRARSRQEALEKRRDIWRKDMHAIQARREEAAAADLMQGRRALMQF